MGREAQHPGPSGLRYSTALLLAGALAVALRSTFIALANRVPLTFVHGLAFQVTTFALYLSIGLVLLALRQELRALDDGRAGSLSASLRWLFVVCVVSWLGFLWLAQPFQRLAFDLATGLCAGLWAALVLGQRRLSSSSPRLARGLDLAAFSLCVAALGLELGLRGYARVRPSPLLARVGVGPGELLQRFRCAPGEVRYGFPCNSRGYYDEEFFRKQVGSDRELIVSIGDSFSVGAVPHAWHFTTLCEELTGARIDSMGVAGIGPPEYAHLVTTEALPLDPDQILVGIFVGNDLNLVDVVADLPDAFLRSWFQRSQVLLSVLPARMARIAGERERLAARGAGVSASQGERWRTSATTRDEVAAAFPWVMDPSLEEGTLSEETFLRLETRRALDICAQDPPSLELLRRSLLEARAAAGAVPLRVMLIPDEFQVEEPLWATVEERAGRPLERDRPQRLLRAWLEREGFEFLDLLPILRAVPPLADGRRHLYHAADTHFNARGNEVVGRVLAEFLK